jgi:CheY-like chemotaxis protein
MTEAPKILVVHEQPAIAERLRAGVAAIRAGEFAGAVVETAGTLGAAIARLEECTPRVILAGLSLPDSKGIATLREIRGKCHETALVALVGDEDHRTGAMAIGSGAQDYIYESESRPDAIEQAMTRAVGRRRVELEHADSGWKSGIGQTAMGLKHEINNPLAALMLNLEMLKEGGHDDADELLDGIEVAAKKIAAVVRRLDGLRTPQRVPAIGGEAMVDFSGDKSGSKSTNEKKIPGGEGVADSGITILLVDDEESVRAIVTKILTRHGHTVLEAEHGADALRLAASHEGKIDLLISDMYMPGLRGPEIVEKLRPSRPGIAVLFMSGYADEDVARSGVAPGTRFLRKPFTVQELSEAVQKALDEPHGA